MRSPLSEAFYKRVSTCVCAALLLYAAGCGVTSSFPGASSFKPLPAGNMIASGPILGYWWDAAASGIRPVLGVAGAAYQGPIIYGGGAYSSAAICARKSVALLTTKPGALYLVSLPSGQPLQLSKGSAAKGKIVFSPSCSSALEYAADGSSAVLIQGVLGTPQLTTIQLPVAGAVLGAAIADSGAVMSAAANSDGSLAVRMLPAGGGPAVPVATLSRFGGLAFLPGTDAALLADGAKNVILMASQAGGNLSLTQVAGAADGVAQPFAVAASSDGRVAIIANDTPANVLRIDLSGVSPAAKVLCACTPSELEPLNGNSVFRLTEPASGTVWAFDGDAPTSKIVFLPADRQTGVAGVGK